MKTTKAKLHLRRVHGKLATRSQGSKALEHVMSLLESNPLVELDFEGGTATPSFVDELVGGLSDQLGDVDFRRRVSLVDMDPSLKPLVRHVLLHRRARRDTAA